MTLLHFRGRRQAETSRASTEINSENRSHSSTCGALNPSEANTEHDEVMAELHDLLVRELTDCGLIDLFTSQSLPQYASEKDTLTDAGSEKQHKATELGNGASGGVPQHWTGPSQPAPADLLTVESPHGRTEEPSGNRGSFQRDVPPLEDQNEPISRAMQRIRAALRRWKPLHGEVDLETLERLKNSIVERSAWFLREQAEQRARWKAMRQNPSYVVEDFTANQRTFFSWIRTSFRMVLTGAAIGKLLHGTSVIILGVLYAALGLICIAAGTMHFYHWQRTLYNHRYLRDSRPFIVVFLGITATSVVALMACWK